MNRYQFSKRSLSAGISKCITSMAVMSLAGNGWAAVQLEEIVVTASKRGEQILQDTPMTIQAISGQGLEDMGASSIEDIAGRVPGFTAFNAGANQKKLKIRGISSTSESEPQETVAIYLDDIPVTGNGGTSNENGASPDLSLFDLNRVEVLKGPQSTLYGAGAMGGTVRYIMNRPNTEAFEGKASAGFSDTEEGSSSWRTDLMLNMPVSDSFALRFVGHYREDGGYIDNLVQTGVQNEPKKGPTSDIDDSSLASFMLTGLWAPSDNFSITGRYLHYDYSVDGESSVDADARVKVSPAITLDRDDLHQVRLIEETNDDELDIYSLTLEYDFGWGTLTSATSYTSRTTVDYQDTSVVPVLFFGATPAPLGGTTGVPIPLINDNDSDQIVEELRLSSNGEGDVQWLIGLYYFDIDKQFKQGGAGPGLDDLLGGATAAFGRADVPFESVTDQTLEQLALFGEVSYRFAEQWELIFGLRWFDVEQDWRQIANGLINGGMTTDVGTAEEDDVNPKVTLSYDLNEDIKIYATAAKGYRVGGVNQPVPLDAGTGCRAEVQSLGLTAAPTSFESDVIWNYELGAKTTWADGRVQINAAIFHIDWEDIQTRRQLGCGFTFFTNSAEADVDGFELDIQAQVTDSLYLSTAIGYNKGELSKDDLFLGALKGDDIPGVSDFTASATARYDFTMLGKDTFVRADYTYASEFDSLFTAGGTNPANREAGGFSVVNLRARMDIQENWSVTIYANNINDKRGVTGTQNNIFGDYEFLLRPRTVGIKTTYAF